jgi:hypothetical protein
MKDKQTIHFGGHLGNYVIRLKHNIKCNHRDSKMIDKSQKGVWVYCDMVSEYLEDEFRNNENFKLLDIDTNRFIDDTDYYFHIFANQRDTYNTIIGWFENEIGDLFQQINRLVLYPKPKLGKELSEINDYIFDKHWDKHQINSIQNTYEDYLNWLQNYYTDVGSGNGKNVEKVIKKKDKTGWGDNLTMNREVS